MAFITKNGFDVEHASSLLVYENLFPTIQHLDGKGCTDKYTKPNDIDSVNAIDITRVLPYAPRFRQIGASANGKWHNVKNEGGYGNAPQSTHYTIPVDLIYDEGVAITNIQTMQTKVEFKSIVIAQLIKTAGMSINIITYAKQLEAFFSTDNFTATSTTAEVAEAIFAGDATKSANEAGSYEDAFLQANAKLTDGIPEIGALQVPVDARQAFVSSNFNRVMKRQYMQNASEASAQILATGFINPFTQQESKRIDTETGICGMYDGVVMTLMNRPTMKYVQVALGLGSGDTEVKALLDKIEAIIVYGAGTCRGIVGPTIEANPNTYFGGVYILPKMKVGVECISGKTIKIVTNGALKSTDVDKITAKVKFTPIDGSVVTGNDVLGTGVMNDGTSN